MEINGYSEDKLINDCLLGDESAFSEVMKRYANKIYSFVVRMIGYSAEADDAVQDVFMKAFSNLNQYDNTRAKFSTWLFTIARNHCVDILRKRKRVYSLDTIYEDTEGYFEPVDNKRNVEELLDKKMQVEFIEKEIEEMREDYREILLLRYIEGFSYQEISEILDIPLGTVKTNLYRAREHLKDRLIDKEVGY
jgi:RNA polymerase sigma-70 factor (ECF subfamily)